ncbi:MULTISPECIES: SPOR domain-containing protein [unclassified Desulfovibrio]|uniref:SPOR domain-containing protein n=1 Tax=unclassified Desulfovibrio TaxID=2593640 RepID=UPI000F604151|nr:MULTISPECIES: SPOR domain-containing protein [unclassified Desulfovibrio]RRD72400.1 SPOR domain-containing protein [Desulfovibrio sp. OH1209_COT-279]RRD88511.1 SPOR domain-containing protein [Desulfovibrio sp. OH1186_COT-070]
MAADSRSSSPPQDKYFRLRPSSLLAACFLVVAAVVLAYLGGVMSGRSHGSSVPAFTMGDGQEPAAGGSGDRADSETPPQKILAPEELRFARVLRGEAPPSVPASPPPASQPVPQSGPQSGSPAGQLPQNPQPAAEQALAAPAAPAVQMYDYEFQVGAFRDEETVDALRQRLEGRGLRTRMQRSGKLYVVLVLLRGDEARAAEVVAIAESMGLGKPMQRGKKPVLRQQ